MSQITVHSLVAMTLAANLSLLPAATPVIGVARSSGSIMINNAKTAGNASLFDGYTVETSGSGSQLQLKSGAVVQLASGSRGKVFSDRMVLEKGTSELQTSSAYQIQALSLKIHGTEANSAAKISLRGPTVQVASLSGHVQVANASGVVVANVAPGMAFDFTPQDSGAAAPQNTPSSAGKAGSSGAGPMGMSAGTTVVAGVIVVATVGATIGVLATQGQSNLSPNGISPGRQ